jgi:NADH dehydrogenase (ubiquinone) 1 alpha subcomplex subunit 5
MLEKLYQETLEKVKILPEKSVYRQNVEKITNYRWKVVKESETVEAIEERVGAGLVEELIEQAKNELQLIPKFKEWKLWEGDAEKIKINILD